MFNGICSFVVHHLAWVIVLFFVCYLSFGDRSNLHRVYLLRSQVLDLQQQCDSQRQRIVADSIRLSDLISKQGGTERAARELYKMKRADEDVFVFVLP